MSSPFKKALDKLGKDLGGEFVELPPKPREQLAYPFNQVSYETECPKGHIVKLSTGYSVYAPDAWDQFGWCEPCGSYYNRSVSRQFDEDKGESVFVTSKLKKGLR